MRDRAWAVCGPAGARAAVVTTGSSLHALGVAFPAPCRAALLHQRRGLLLSLSANQCYMPNHLGRYQEAVCDPNTVEHAGAGDHSRSARAALRSAARLRGCQHQSTVACKVGRLWGWDKLGVWCAPDRLSDRDRALSDHLPRTCYLGPGRCWCWCWCWSWSSVYHHQVRIKIFSYPA